MRTFRRNLSLALFTAVFAIAGPAWADILVDDFEDVSDWTGLTLETVEVHGGSGAGRWEDHENQGSVRKAYTPALDASGEGHLQFWIFSGSANDAPVELILGSENEADPAGSDYYRYSIKLDWQGWRYLRIPLESFQAARSPVGWHKVDSISLHASGWGHDPVPGTVVILDDMTFGTGVIDEVRVQSAFQGSDYVYDFTLLLEDRTGAARDLALTIEPVGANPFDLLVVDPTVSLAANATGQAQVRVTVPASAISDATRLDLHRASVFVSEAGVVCDGTELSAAVPLPARDHPRTLLDASDFTRIDDLAQSEAWAASVRDGIIGRADAWPGDFEQEYELSEWALPPEGGQWTLWYVCPTHGVRLRYEGPTAHVCPVDGEVHSGWPFDQVVYSWMHSDLAAAARDAGLAYRMTGQVSYAQEALEILIAYADAYDSYDLHDIHGEPTGSGGRVLSQTLDESVWLIPVAWAFDLIADAPVMTDAQRAHIEQDLLRPAVATIARHPAGISNWQSWHNAGMGAVGFALEDPALIATVLRGSEGFEFQMQQSVTSDGFWYEGSWGYHFYALSALMQLAEMASRAGYDAYANPSLRGMFEAPLLFAMPDWTLPAFNDSGTSSLVSNDRYYEVAYKRYQDERFTAVLGVRDRGRDALFFGEPALPSSADLGLESHLFQDAGYAVMRAGQGDDALYLALDFGPHGGGHGHYDKLGLVLFARGTVMGVDPGTQSYAAPTHKTWDKVTVAHNTVVVDETTQLEATGSLHRFEALPDVTLASADAGEANPTASLVRTLLMTPEYVIDHFRASSTDGGEHDFDWVHHNTGTLSTELALASYDGLPGSEGYQHLSDVSAAAVDDGWEVRFAHALEEMEYGNTWANESAIGASFTHSEAQAQGGDWSGKMTYDFSSATGYVLYGTERPDEVQEVPESVSLALYGDGSGHVISLRVYDDTEERFVQEVGPVDWTGWKAIEIGDLEGWNHYLGNDDGVFDPPVRSVAMQLSHAAGGPATGTLYADDIRLGYASAGEVVVADFEIPARSLSVRMLGSPGTRVVAGEGLGPDLTEPVAFVMARRSGVESLFSTVFAPYGKEPRVTGFEALGTDAAAQDEAGAYRVEAGAFSDDVLFVAGGTGSVVRSFGDHACDGTLCLIRRDGQQALSRLALVAGRQLDESGVSRVEAESAFDGLQADYRDGGTSLSIRARVSIDMVARIWGPDVVAVEVGGVGTPFTREGEYVVLNLAPVVEPDGGVGIDGGDDGGEAGAGGRGGGSEGEGGGCGCFAAGRGGDCWAAVLGVLALLWSRRRSAGTAPRTAGRL